MYVLYELDITIRKYKKMKQAIQILIPDESDTDRQEFIDDLNNAAMDAAQRRIISMVLLGQGRMGKTEICMRVISQLLLTIILFIMTCTVNAMAIEVYFPGNKASTQPLIDIRGGIMHVVVITSGAAFKCRPSRNSADLPDPPDFMETLIAYEKTSDHRYYLLKKRTGAWGWMHIDDILAASVCLRSNNPKNPAFMKVVTKNNWEHKKSFDKYIYYFKGPGEHFQKNGIIDIFNIQYAFKRIKGSDSKEYIFFGAEPVWDYGSPAESLKGWIQADCCILWDNQVAVYYNKETLKHNQRRPLPVFHQKKHLMAHLENGSMSHIIGFEQSNPHRILPETKRFPVIDFQGNVLNIFWMNNANQCFEGWVSKKDRNNVDQLDCYCLMRRNQLDIFIGLMGVIIDGLRFKSRSIEKNIYRACEQVTGFSIIENEMFAAYLQRIFHIPYKEISSALRKTPEEIESDFLIDKTFRNHFIKQLKRSYKRIRFIQEKKFTEIQWDQLKKEWLDVSEPIEKEWFFISSSGIEYCWVPLEYLP
jgi:hypothetical protein